MLKQYFLDIMRKGCNGLYLCEVPTGIGKSYQAAHTMEEYVKEIREEYAKAMRQCARTITDERKLIYANIYFSAQTRLSRSEIARRCTYLG